MRRKQLIIIGVVSSVIFILACLVTYLFINQNSYGSSISIDNPDKELLSLSKKHRELIEANLYNTVEVNTPKEKINGNAHIRNKSHLQTFNKDSDIYTGQFILDINQIEQTYVISYKLSNAEEVSSEYFIEIRCPLPSEVQFKNTKCKDLLSGESIVASNPIFQYLPYDNLTFVINAVESKDTPAILPLTVEVYVPELSLSEKEDYLASTKKEVEDWIKNKGLNPKDYDIRYIEIDLNQEGSDGSHP